MKHALITLAFASALLSSAALAQSVGEKTGVNSTLGIAPKTEDFIKEAAMSDMLEIESGKIAQQEGNAKEKTLLLKCSPTIPKPVPNSRVWFPVI